MKQRIQRMKEKEEMRKKWLKEQLNMSLDINKQNINFKH